MNVNIKFQFTGGIGFANVNILKSGQNIATFSYKTGDPDPPAIPLTPGLYSISMHGVSPPGGTTVTIDQTTNPVTPYAIPAGPFSGVGFVLEVIN